MANILFKFSIILFKIAGIGIKKPLFLRTFLFVFVALSIHIITNIWGIYKHNFDHFVDVISNITRPCYVR